MPAKADLPTCETAGTEKDTRRPDPPGRMLINRKQCRQKVPLCDRTILDMEKRGEFPKRFLIARNVVVWDFHEVEAWIERNQAANVQATPPASGSGKSPGPAKKGTRDDKIAK
jgi:predicted DNA-binding transcriptional regulator AlpA